MSASGGQEVQPGGMGTAREKPSPESVLSEQRPVLTPRLDAEWVRGGSRVRLSKASLELSKLISCDRTEVW